MVRRAKGSGGRGFSVRHLNEWCLVRRCGRRVVDNVVGV